MQSSDLAAPPAERRIYCNRTLNLRAIGAIGYDMDYTLIQYRAEAWERCAFEHARQRLAAQGWPVEGLSLDAVPTIQGLIVDRQHGNLLKVNRFGFVKSASHGGQPLAFEEQRRLYSRTVVDHRDPRFAFMSTLFSLSESSLYSQLVAQWDQGALPQVADHGELYTRVREALDEAHRLGELKAEILADPEHFVDRDPDTARALLDQREAGKKLMLITNSEWSYTRPMMSFAFDSALPDGMGWRELFDLVIVSARKPDFFNSRSPLLQVVDDEGLMRPVDGALPEGAVFFGGNAARVEEALELTGDQILYVGDHFFGDVHATKRVLRWRTAMVMRELEQEILDARDFAERERLLAERMARKEALEQHSYQLRVRLQRARSGREPLEASQRDALHRELAELREQQATLDQEIAPLASAAATLGNEHWGPLLRAGNDKSYLAFLVERHADIYTSRVSNFLHETPFRYFRSARGSLPHDLPPRATAS